jgi:hypothetical protein
MSVLIALFTVSLALYFLNLFYQLAKVEKAMQGTVSLLEKFMVLRYNLKNESEDGKEIKVTPEA